ncbi:MAG: hypothetical protein B6U68_01470 [Candidatus Aenigmarchaeota archaeon ex4484_14]|nr:MAG: hypothetical protein B6U68_01470 [Candidatus Aenigmarchaeota archaeon ex4484_14]
MVLRFKEAVIKAEKNEKVKELKKQGYFLISAFTMLTLDEEICGWKLHYYNPKKKNIHSFMVGKDVVFDGVSPAMSESKEMDPSKFRILSEDAIEEAKKDFEDDLLKIMITARFDQKLNKNVWSVNLVRKDMSICSFTISGEEKKILSKKEISLMKR